MLTIIVVAIVLTIVAVMVVPEVLQIWRDKKDTYYNKYVIKVKVEPQSGATAGYDAPLDVKATLNKFKISSAVVYKDLDGDGTKERNVDKTQTDLGPADDETVHFAIQKDELSEINPPGDTKVANKQTASSGVATVTIKGLKDGTDKVVVTVPSPKPSPLPFVVEYENQEIEYKTTNP